jgi:nitrate/nitrite transporter NarK
VGRGTAAVYSSAVAYGVLSFTLASWLPSYFVDTFSLSTTSAGLYSIAPWIGLALAAVWAGVVTDRMIARGRDRLVVRKIMMTVGLGFAALGCLLLTVIPSPQLAAVCCGISFIGIGISTPGYIPIPAELFPRHGEIFYGIMAAVGSVSAVVVVSLTGAILDATDSYNLLYLLLAALCTIAIVIFLLFGSVAPVLEADKANAATVD